MEFKEFKSPEEKDYDVKESLNNLATVNNNHYINPYVEQLIDLIGILEDVSELELQQNYGITLQEYYNPNEETISKVKEHLGIKRR